MAKINCRLICHSISIHLQQIYTGFFMLQERGLINLTQSVLKENIIDTKKPQHLRDARHAHLRVILNDSLKLHYDTHDSWEIDTEYLSDTDFYFKRSFLSSRLDLNKDYKKIYPLGLNYLVYPSQPDRFAFQRGVILGKNMRQKLSTSAHSLKLLDRFEFVPRVNVMESLPDYDAPPKILFMVRAWDPYGDNPDPSEEKIEERMEINKARVSCVKLLRDEFGENFYGGLSHTSFGIKNYRDVLIPENTLSSKRNYISLLRSYPICIATTGLHRSIGWKFAEYVAFSKAILSEKLNYEVPGGFEEGENYLEFSSPEDCVNKARKLVSDRKLRNYLMTNNAKYYQSYLRPDSLILNTILTALSARTCGR